MDAAEDDRLDRDLVEQAQRGDREAFAILARTHGDRLMAIAQRILRDVGRAEDAWEAHANPQRERGRVGDHLVGGRSRAHRRA